MRLIDTHCHFDDAGFAGDRPELIQQMQAVGVSDLIVPAITAASWPGLQAVCQAYPGLHAAYGLHPVYLEAHDDAHLVALRQWLEKKRPVAVGECGLDFFLPGLAVERQHTVFVAQLRLAKEYDLPLIIHARRAVDQVLKHIRQIGGLRGVVHSFAGSRQQADMLVAQGFCLGVGGTVTYERAQRLRTIVADLPDEALLLETDAPDQPDSQWRGRRNIPQRLAVIAESVAGLRSTSVERLAEVTTANAQRIFGIV